MCIFFLYLFLIPVFLLDFIIVRINLIQLLATILIRLNYLFIYLIIITITIIIIIIITIIIIIIIPR